MVSWAALSSIFDGYAALIRWTGAVAVLRSRHSPSHVRRGREVERINCHHNYAAVERHVVGNDIRDLWITRKDAIRAGLGERGLIPGSMGTKSYVVSGLGNALSWQSCSHGAGRRLSRTEAKRRHTAKDLREQMQADLVRIDHTLSQVLNYKGT